MKNFFLFIVTLSFLNSSAQKITTDEAPAKFYTGMRNAVTTTVYENSLADVIIEWERFLKKFKYETVSDSRNEVTGHNLFFKDIIDRPVDIYSTFTENKEEKSVKMSTAVDMGASNYLKSDVNPAEIKVLEKMVADFARELTKAPFAAYLKAAISFREKLNTEQISLDKDTKKLNGEIVNYKNKISKTEKKSEEVKVILGKKKSEVDEQKKITDTISDPENAKSKTYKKTLDKLLKQQKDIEEDIGDLEKEVTAIREQIKKTETSIKKNEDLRLANIKELENQKVIAEKWQKKLAEVS